jgi:hypothetical protein
MVEERDMTEEDHLEVTVQEEVIEEMTQELESLSEKADASNVARRVTLRETVLALEAVQEVDQDLHLKEEKEMTDTEEIKEVAEIIEEADLQVPQEVSKEITRVEEDQVQRDQTDASLSALIIKNIKKLIPDKNLIIKNIHKVLKMLILQIKIVCQLDL